MMAGPRGCSTDQVARKDENTDFLKNVCYLRKTVTFEKNTGSPGSAEPLCLTPLTPVVHSTCDAHGQLLKASLTTEARRGLARFLSPKGASFSHLSALPTSGDHVCLQLCPSTWITDCLCLLFQVLAPHGPPKKHSSTQSSIPRQNELRTN